jgi:curved DNA-binding protein CbpA
VRTALGSGPYAVLGIARDATDAQIVQARHRLVRKYHPDVNHDRDATARFGDVQRAFDLLSDPAARAEYDRTHDEQGRTLVLRAADGGYGLGGQAAAAGVLIEPTSVNLGCSRRNGRWQTQRSPSPGPGRRGREALPVTRATTGGTS